ncbi:hypothetical protein PRIPAC_97620 [Pristionchus pacificus]|uniref:Uncharacterized protein n=1 Tax=Pristionchus pacificus TaxID=54126 RepID=A0A2A6BD52_PRIPA|nr:hypothetical protein PRIPAC_97620 [Pristionchus pacificus]|eukprot:PDM63812.1 hypothetical protein PRIPAC_49785 [Pristionchus pacificus]
MIVIQRSFTTDKGISSIRGKRGTATRQRPSERREYMIRGVSLDEQRGRGSRQIAECGVSAVKVHDGRSLVRERAISGGRPSGGGLPPSPLPSAIPPPFFIHLACLLSYSGTPQAAKMTIRYGSDSTLPTINSIDFNQIIPHANSMHILIKLPDAPPDNGCDNPDAVGWRVRHSRSLVSRGLLYSRLYDEKCYRSSAAFYRDWVEALMSEGSRAEVDSIIELAKENEATPMKMLEKTIESLAEDNMELREKVLTVLGDVTHDITTIIREAEAPAAPTNFTVDELNFVLSSTKMSEVLVYLGAALAPPEALHLISERIGAMRVVAYEVDAQEPK